MDWRLSPLRAADSGAPAYLRLRHVFPTVKQPCLILFGSSSTLTVFVFCTNRSVYFCSLGHCLYILVLFFSFSFSVFLVSCFARSHHFFVNPFSCPGRLRLSDWERAPESDRGQAAAAAAALCSSSDGVVIRHWLTSKDVSIAANRCRRLEISTASWVVNNELGYFLHRSAICEPVKLQMDYSVLSMATIAVACGRTVARSEESLQNRSYLWNVGIFPLCYHVSDAQLFARCLWNLLFCK